MLFRESSPRFIYTMQSFFSRKHRRSRFNRDFCVLFILTFAVVLPTLSCNLRHTAYDVFFRGDESQESNILKIKNQERFLKSLEILNRTSFGFSFTNRNATSRDILNRHISSANEKSDKNGYISDGIALTIITVSRNKQTDEDYKPHYLVQSVATFLQVINRTSINIPLHFSVCNVDKVPKSHTDLDYLPKWIPVLQRFVKPDYSRLTYNELLDKEKEDYVFCLQQALRHNMTYALLVEDDTLPFSDLFYVIKTKVLQMKSEDRRDSMNNILFVKLYHPERLLGFISLQYERLPELFSLAVIFTGILVKIYNKWRENGHTSQRKLFCMFFVYSLCVLLSLGRQNILQLRSFSTSLYQMTPAAGCCTPAMLFPREGGQVVADFLRQVKCKKGFAKDTALEQLVKSGYKSKMIQPNLFQHIGYYSSLRSGFINPFLVQ